MKNTAEGCTREPCQRCELEESLKLGRRDERVNEVNFDRLKRKQRHFFQIVNHRVFFLLNKSPVINGPSLSEEAAAVAATRVSWLFHMPASFRKTSANRTTSRLVRLLLDMAPRTVLERCWPNTERAADRRRRRRLDDNNDLCRDATPVAVAAAVDTTFAGRRTAVASPSTENI